jgi:hypothetical protein
MSNALLDVSDVLVDPDLASTFNVVRRTQTTNSHGRAVNGEKRFEDVLGVVCSASRNDLERMPDFQFTGRCISIVTQFRLQATIQGRQADTVEWEGSNFVVRYLDLYPQYGKGFVQAICESMDSQDPSVREN